jgi:hypothetical protein
VRLAGAGAAAALAFALGGAGWSPPPAERAAAAEASVTPWMTPREVAGLVGRPAVVEQLRHGRCWTYREPYVLKVCFGRKGYAWSVASSIPPSVRPAVPDAFERARRRRLS